MRACRLCGDQLSTWARIDGVRRNLGTRKYCLSCSPRGKHNTRKLEELNRVESPTKSCPRCKLEKPNAAFYLRTDGRRSFSWCKLCNNEHRRARFRDDRYAALLHYSGGDIRCCCCGERQIEFLALDHVNDDGAEHRRVVGGGGRPFYTWLRKTAYTYDALAVACHNCNMARSMYGECPHKRAP